MSLADLPFDIVYDVLSLVDFPTRPPPTSSDPTKAAYKPDYETFELFQKLCGPWNRALLKLKYAEINRVVFEEATVDFHLGELYLFPHQVRTNDVCCVVSFDEDLSQIRTIRTSTIRIDHAEPSESCPVDVKTLAELFHEPKELTIKNLTSKNRVEGEFLAHLTHDFTDIHIENVQGQARALKKFLPKAMKSPKLSFLKVENCRTYKTFSDDVLHLMKNSDCREIRIERSKHVDYAFYESIIAWSKQEGAGKKREIYFSLQKDAGQRLHGEIGDVQTRRFFPHTDNKTSGAYVCLYDCRSYNARVSLV